MQPREGMSASVEIVVEMRQNVLLVPSQAVRSAQGSQVVSLVTGEAMEERPVEVGLSDGRDTEIISGLQEGDKVVLPESAVITPRSGGPGGFGGGRGGFGGGGILH